MVVPDESMAGMVPQYLEAIWADLIARLCGFVSLAFTLLGVYSTWLAGNSGVAHARWYFWAAAEATFIITNYRIWADERRSVNSAQLRAEEAMNKDRPEAFVTLSFGPGRVGAGSIGLQNCGIRDARNVQILPLHLNGIYQGRAETKKLTFPHLSYLPRKEHPDYPTLTINDVLDLETEGELAFFLSSWCDRWEKPGLEFELSVQWFDSSGNGFRSNSKVSYSRPEHKCRTVTGFVEYLKPLPQE